MDSTLPTVPIANGSVSPNLCTFGVDAALMGVNDSKNNLHASDGEDAIIG